MAASVRTGTVTRAGLVLSLGLWTIGSLACGSGSAEPPRLSDDDFWRLVTTLSEPPGTFRHSENLVSNEELFPHIIRMLGARGGVFVGVGPEQNFSYIVRVRPAMAFIIDIRQENRNLHLLYKALFELSDSRLEFVSKLFSRGITAEFDAADSVHDLFSAVESAAASSAKYDETAQLVRRHLLDHHRLPLTVEDLQWIDYALRAFYLDGPGIHYSRSLPKDAPGPSYRVLMTATDMRGVARSYLASEDSFDFVKDLHARNLIVPIVGDFAGPTALKKVGAYVRERGSVVSAFYASNVEVYLSNQQMVTFCDNLIGLPTASDASFIGSKSVRPLTLKLSTCLPAPAKR